MGQMWDDNIVSFTTINIFFYCIQGSSRGGGGDIQNTDTYIYLAELTMNLRFTAPSQLRIYAKQVEVWPWYGP